MPGRPHGPVGFQRHDQSAKPPQRQRVVRPQQALAGTLAHFTLVLFGVGSMTVVSGAVVLWMARYTASFLEVDLPRWSFLDIELPRAGYVPVGGGIVLLGVMRLLDLAGAEPTKAPRPLRSLASEVSFKAFALQLFVVGFLVDTTWRAWQLRNKLSGIRFLEALRAVARIWHRLRHIHEFASGLIRTAVRVIPEAHRERYEEEWLGELDKLNGKGWQLLILSLRIVRGAPRTALVLLLEEASWPSWISEHLGQTPHLRRTLIAAAGVFGPEVLAFYLRGSPPTDSELVQAVLAALLQRFAVVGDCCGLCSPA
jgi:hypothetical protein